MIAVCTKQLIQDFFRVRLKVKFAVSPWLVGSVPLYVCAHQLSAKASSLWHGQYRQGASRRVCVCVSEVYRVLGVTVDRLEYLQVTCPLILLGRLFDGVCEAINRIYVLFMPSKNPICHSLKFFPSPHHAGHGSVHWIQYETWASLALSCLSGKAKYSFSCSHILSQEKL